MRIQTLIICGNGINAHSLYRILERQDWPGHIVFVRHASEPKGFVGAMGYAVEQPVGGGRWAVSSEQRAVDTNRHPLNANGQQGAKGANTAKRQLPTANCPPTSDLRSPRSYALPLKSTQDLPAWVEANFPDGAVVFFTDERWHPAFLEWKQAHPESKIHCFLGSESHLTVILDRYEFCTFIAEKKLANVPETIRGDEDPFASFGDTFIVRPRLSWKGVAQRERVKLVEGREAFDQVIRDFADRGIDRGELSFQEKLSIRDEDNVSVCGWFGPEAQHLYCTRKVRQWPPKTGGGDLVERIEPPGNVMDRTRSLLVALAYEGPFELEFVFDENSREYMVTELNPRFWLQHGLVDQLSGSALVRRTLGQDPQSERFRAVEPQYWVNPLYAVQRCLKLDTLNLRCWVSYKGWAPFSLQEAVRYAFSLFQSKFGS